MNEEENIVLQFSIPITQEDIKNKMLEFYHRNQQLQKQLQAYQDADQERSCLSKTEVNDLIKESAQYRLQVQAYKDKEDKLRKYFNTTYIELDDNALESDIIRQDILQILNEGSGKQ